MTTLDFTQENSPLGTDKLVGFRNTDEGGERTFQIQDLPFATPSELDAKADLVDGKVPGSQLPVAPVVSVNGQTGAVELDANDVGASSKNGEGVNYLVVDVSADNAEINANNLMAAYEAAKLLTPNGMPLSSSNKAWVVLPPANYDLPLLTWVVDSDFVGLVAAVDGSVDVTGDISVTSTAAVIQGIVGIPEQNVWTSGVSVVNCTNAERLGMAGESSVYIVSGAGSNNVNGRYTYNGAPSGYPTFINESETGEIFYNEDGFWVIFDVVENLTAYSNTAPQPSDSGWVVEGGLTPAPSVTLGNPFKSGQIVRVTNQANRIEQFLGGDQSQNDNWLVLKNTVEMSIYNPSVIDLAVNGVSVEIGGETYIGWVDPDVIPTNGTAFDLGNVIVQGLYLQNLAFGFTYNEVPWQRVTGNALAFPIKLPPRASVVFAITEYNPI